MPGGKAVALDLMNRVSAPRWVAEDQTGVSWPMSATPGRWRVLAGSFAEQWRMACSKSSGASQQLGQVRGPSSSQDGRARRELLPDLIWCRRPASNLERPIKGWGFSEGR